MSRVWAIFKKEFMSYFNSLMAYFFVFVFLAVVNLLFMWFAFFNNRTTVMTDYFEFVIIAMWLFIPGITMRMWAEEKNLGTLELLMTMPVRDVEAVAGKFLASFAFLALTLALSFVTIPTALAYVGDLDWGPVIGGYLGLLLLGSCFISVGLAMSSMTQNQFIAFLLSSMICLAFLGVSELFQLVPVPRWIVYFEIYLVTLAVFLMVFWVVFSTIIRIRWLAFGLAFVAANFIGGVATRLAVFLKLNEFLQEINFPNWELSFISFIDAGSHFDSIGRGVIDSRDLVYYLSFICFFLVLNYRAVTARRWK
jgi:ABC-2 type transport system permease protein